LGINPEAYIRWVLPKRAATNKTANNLLPHDFARLQVQPDQIDQNEGDDPQPDAPAATLYPSPLVGGGRQCA
jgi:hypothetical protein